MRSPPRAGTIMNRRPLLLSPQSLVRDAARLLIGRSLVAAPVVDRESRFLGVFSHHGLMLALVHAAHHELPAAPVTDYLEPPPPVLAEDTDLMSVAQVFVASSHAHPLLPVLRGDELVGTITRLDLARAILRTLAAAGGPETAAVYLSATEPEAAPFRARPSGGTGRRG